MKHRIGGNRSPIRGDISYMDGVHPDACERAVADLSARLDGELDGNRMALLDAHLRHCPACNGLATALNQQHRAFRVRRPELLPDRSVAILDAIRPVWTSSLKRRRRRRLGIAAVGVSAAAACIAAASFNVTDWHDRSELPLLHPSLSVSRASITPGETGQASVLTFEITNESEIPDALVEVDLPASITSDVALHVVRHADTELDSTASTMRSVDELTVEAHNTKVFDETSSHVMLLDLATPLTTGETIPVTFRFATSDPIEIRVHVG